MTNFAPRHSSLISQEECKHIYGTYAVQMQKSKIFDNLGFWAVHRYYGFEIVKSEKGIQFKGQYIGTSHQLIDVSNSDISCSGNILSVDIDNNTQNNGGVSVYEARKIQFFSYEPGVVIARTVQTSTGLFMLIPVVATEDSIVTLRSRE